MKVKDLIKIIQDQDPESEVIIQKDAEGNEYSPLGWADGEAVYIPETNWSGTAYSISWTAEDACMTSAEWEEIKRRPRCVVLAPIN